MDHIILYFGKEITMKKILMIGIYLFLIVGVFSLTSVLAQPKELKIGLLDPLTGSGSMIGQRMSYAFKMAADEVNGRGGVLGYQIKLIEWDTMGETERGLTGAKKLIESDQVWGLAGIFRSGVALAVADIVAASKKPLMITNAASPAVTGLVKKDYNKYKYIFRTGGLSSNFSGTAVPFLTDIIKAKTFFIVSENTEHSRNLVKAAKETLEPKGIKCIGEAYVDPATVEFMGELLKIKSLKPDAVVVSLPASGGVPFQKQYYDAKMRIPHVTMPGPMAMRDVVGEMGEKSNYCAFTSFCWDVPITKKTIPFYQRFTKIYGAPPEGYPDVRAYDGLLILLDGIKRAGSLDVDKVIKALEQTDFKGVSGRYVFDETHQVKWGEGYLVNVIGQWINGKAYIIWPKAYATAPYKKDPR
jgi:branched-chain amino acid transport system substrate-binding protein